jgi:putative spermidine/putrescine transport system permease protein
MSDISVKNATPAKSAQGYALSKKELGYARREVRRHKLLAFSLVVPLLLFLVFAFVAPIGSMLHQGFYNPVVNELVPDTLSSLEEWDGKALPSKLVFNTMAKDLKRLALTRDSGKFSAEINRYLPGSSSVIKSSARKLKRVEDVDIADNGAQLLLATNDEWSKPRIWRSIQQAGSVYTDRNYLTALDLERNQNDEIKVRESAQVYMKLYTKTLKLALIITLLCLLLGYPLAYYLANAPSKKANLLMILVMLPFWTSLLVRTTAWIALLQTNGVINTLLLSVGIISEPLELLYTEFSTIVAMTHILLPFMILPLYSVMKGVDPSFFRAAMSMGARPIGAFIQVYFPATLPGLSAGALLVFIISVGYYITPALVGGTDGQMISNIIAFHMQQSNNWSLAAALGTLLLILILALYWTYDKFIGASNIKLG